MARKDVRNVSMNDSQTLSSCPFCGGEARHYAPGPIDHHIECVECYADIHRDTEAEAIAAWNTRADYHGYEQAAIEAWESIKAWNTRAELGSGTCEVEVRESAWGGYTRHCGNCGADLDCDTRNKQNFCPNCGKRVSE